jgi:hypothetical protein
MLAALKAQPELGIVIFRFCSCYLVKLDFSKLSERQFELLYYLSLFLIRLNAIGVMPMCEAIIFNGILSRN